MEIRNMLSNLKNFAIALATKAVGSQRMRRYWISRNGKQGREYLDMYWNGTDNKNRQALIELVVDHVPTDGSVLEFGSHVGVNLRMIKERRAADNIQLIAVEPSPEIFSYLVKKMPYALAMQADDEAFIASNFPNHPTDVSLVNGVFCVMSGKRVQSVIQKLARISDVMIIGDNIDNLDGASSILHSSPACFSHPLRTMLMQAGMEKIELRSVPFPDQHINGYIIATKSKPSEENYPNTVVEQSRHY